MPRLTYAGEPLLLDHCREADRFVEQYQRLDDTALQGPFPHRQTWQTNPLNGGTGVGLPLVNWPAGPPLRINQLYWPCTGASRWAEGLFLCTGATRRLLDTCTNASAGAELRWDTDNPPQMTGTLLGDAHRFIAWNLYPLAFRRVGGCHYQSGDPLDPNGVLSVNDVDDHDLYLVHLVDRRYWWQFVEAPAICEYLASWSALVDYLCDQLGITMLWAAQDLPLPSAYDVGPHPSEWSRPYHNAAQLLDAALESLGARLVATADAAAASYGGFEIQRAAGAEACFLQNLSTQNLQEQLAGTWCDLAYTRALPAYVNVAFPQSRYGQLCGQCEESASSTEQDCHESYYVLDHALAEYLDTTQHCAVQSTAKTIFVRGWADLGICTDSSPMNNTELVALAGQIAGDWYRYHARQYDFTTIGPTAWDACGFDDSIIYKMGIESDDGYRGVAVAPGDDPRARDVTSEVILTPQYRRDISARIQSLPLNVGADVQLHATNALELPEHLIAETPVGGIAAPSGSTISGELCVAYLPVGQLACGTLTRTKVTAIDADHLGDDYQVMVYQPICGAVAAGVFVDTGPFKCCARRVLVECCEESS